MVRTLLRRTLAPVLAGAVVGGLSTRPTSSWSAAVDGPAAAAPAPYAAWNAFAAALDAGIVARNP